MHEYFALMLEDFRIQTSYHFLPATSAAVLWGIDVTSIVFALAAALRHHAAGDFLDSGQADQDVNGAAKSCHVAEKGGDKVKIKGADEAPV